jgi:hypothetical protein
MGSQVLKNSVQIIILVSSLWWVEHVVCLNAYYC